MSYPGVVKTYAIQAGRELRVIVAAEKISDAEVKPNLSGLIKTNPVRNGIPRNDKSNGN